MAENDRVNWGRPKLYRVDAAARSGHVACCINKYLLIWGGYQDDTQIDKYLPPEELWVYHIELQFWKLYITKGQIPKGTSGAGFCSIDNYLYLFAGHTGFGNNNNVFRLELQGFEWEELIANGPLPSPRDKFAMWSHNNKFYCFGGFGPSIHNYLCDHGDYISDPTTYLTQERGWNNQLLVFDTTTESWTNPRTTSGPPCPRAAHAAAKVGTQVYIFGGRHCETRMNDIHCINLDTLQWSGELHPTGPIPCGRSWHSLTPVASQRLFMYGGYSNDNIPLSDSWVLDVTVLQWTQLSVSNNQPRLWHTASFVNDEDVLIFGGCCNDILDFGVNNMHSNEILLFHFQPYSLVRLSLELLFKCREQTEIEWSYLPRELRNWLTSKSECMAHEHKQQISIDRHHNRIENQTTCSVS
ncbi:hypothetical protein ScPMuIL_014312 [Solemya velum]